MGKKLFAAKDKVKILTVFLAIGLLLGSAGKVSAQKNDSKENQDKRDEAPITVLADYIHYDNVSGDLFAEGSVRVIRDDQTLYAERIDGNVNTGDVWTETLTRFTETSSGSDFTGDYAKYNYNTKLGHIYNVQGRAASEYITAESMDILPEKMVGQNATMTRCNATKHVKCQHTTATRVDIWPNDRIIAYNANVYILGTKVYSQKRYVAALGESKRQIPRIGYNSDDGVYIKDTIIYPLGNKTSVGADLFAGTKKGGRTMGWLDHNERNFDLRYSYGYERDDDNEWIKKEHNLRANYKTKQLFSTPLRYRFWFERGRWSDKHKSSWHTEAGVYLAHTPIYLGSQTFYLTLGTGYRKLKESYNDIEQDEYRYDIGLYKNFPKWNFSLVYSNVNNYVNLFEYNAINVAESLTYVIGWVPDAKNRVSFLQQYDTANKRVYKNRITYVRNLHCWDLVLYYERERYTYKSYDSKISWEIHLAI